MSTISSFDNKHVSKYRNSYVLDCYLYDFVAFWNMHYFRKQYFSDLLVICAATLEKLSRCFCNKLYFNILDNYFYLRMPG